MDGYVMIGSNDVEVLPVWPEKEFAELFLTDSWTNYTVEEQNISDFLNWLDILALDNVKIAAFPNLDLNTVHVSAKKMKADLNFEISQYE